jgi:hypothetical protein
LHVGEARSGLLHVSERSGHVRSGIKGRLTGEHLEHDDTEGVKIGSSVRLPTLHLLR